MPESDARSVYITLVCTLHYICCSISMLSWSVGLFFSEPKPAGPDRTPKPAGDKKGDSSLVCPLSMERRVFLLQITKTVRTAQPRRTSLSRFAKSRNTDPTQPNPPHPTRFSLVSWYILSSVGLSLAMNFETGVFEIA